jgi:hypothetical protein
MQARFSLIIQLGHFFLATVFGTGLEVYQVKSVIYSKNISGLEVCAK